MPHCWRPARRQVVVLCVLCCHPLIQHTLNDLQFASVLYSGTTGIINYSFGQCAPLTIGSDTAQEAVTCQDSDCNGYTYVLGWPI